MATPLHIPRAPILIWILLSIPFTIWDTLYVFLRPHTLLGHKWHSPLFIAMDSYSAVDGIYSEKAWLNNEGWTAAQSVVNVTEVLIYVVYFVIVWRNGWRKGVRGRAAARAVVLGLAAGTVTLTKSMLYFMNECFSGFKYVGHSTWPDLLATWGFMNLLYISASSYMIFTFASDIINGLSKLEIEQSLGKKRGVGKRE